MRNEDGDVAVVTEERNYRNMQHELINFYKEISFTIMYAKMYRHALRSAWDQILLEEQKTADSSGNQETKRKESKELSDGESTKDMEKIKKPYSDDAWRRHITVFDSTPFMKDEVSNNSPALFTLVFTNLWGIAEAKVDDLALRMMRQYPEKILTKKEFSSLTGKYVELYELELGELIEHAYNDFKRTIEPGKKVGVGRFESILNAVGLGGGVDDEIRKCLLEMSEIRNNLVHRMGVVDNKLKKACPHLTLTKGQKYRIAGYIVEGYADCLKYYVMEIDLRFNNFVGKTQSDFASSQRQWHLNRVLAMRSPQKEPS